MQFFNLKHITHILSHSKDFFITKEYSIKTKDELLKLVEDSHHYLEMSSPVLLDTASIAETVVSQRGDSLKYFSKNIRDNEDIVKKAIEQDPLALCYASKRIICDEKISLPLIKKNSNVFKLIPQEVRENLNYIEALIQSGDRNFLSKISDEFISNDNNLKQVFILMEANNYLIDSTNPEHSQSLNSRDFLKLFSNENFKNICQDLIFYKFFEMKKLANESSQATEIRFIDIELKNRVSSILDKIDNFHILNTVNNVKLSNNKQRI